jgi:hypothetical protein
VLHIHEPIGKTCVSHELDCVVSSSSSSSMRNIASAAATPSHHVHAVTAAAQSSHHDLTPTKQQQQQQPTGGGVGTQQNTETTMSAAASAVFAWNQRTATSLQRGQVGVGQATQSARSDRQIRTAHSNDDYYRNSSSSTTSLYDVSSLSAHPSQGRERQQKHRRRSCAALEPTAVTTLNCDSFPSPNQLLSSTRSVAQRQHPSPFTQVQSPSPSLKATTTTIAAQTLSLKKSPSSTSCTSRNKTTTRSSKLVQPARASMGGMSSNAGKVCSHGEDSNEQCRAPTTNTTATNRVATLQNSPPKKTATNVRASTRLKTRQGGHDRKGHGDQDRLESTRRSPPRAPRAASSTTRSPITTTGSIGSSTGTSATGVSRSHEHSLHVQATRQSIDGTYRQRCLFLSIHVWLGA